MKTILKVLPFVFFAASCAGVQSEGDGGMTAIKPLPDRVQEMVVAVQSDAISALPAEIEGFKSEEPVADREKNQRGAGFTRVYTSGDAVVTVFVYNNREFGVTDGVSFVTERQMDKHLEEFQALQDSGLYENLKTGDKKTREFKWRSVPYAVSEAEVRFTQKDAPKVSFLVLGGNKDLMSFVRIRFTYPKSMQKRMNSKRNAFTRTVMSSLHDFAETLIPPAPENAAAE